MSPKSASLALALVVAGLFAPGAAQAACNGGFKVSDPAGGGSFYATHELTVTATGDSFVDGRTLSAPGARRIDPDSTDLKLVRDTPGPLTISAMVEGTDSTGGSCATPVSVTVQLRPALSLLVKVRRPHKSHAGNGDLIYPDPPVFSVNLKHRTGSNRAPITVRARVVGRAKLPGKGAKAVTRVFAQRSSDATDTSEPRCTLICSPETKRGFAKRTSVAAFPIDGRNAVGGLRVRLEPPTGYSTGFRNGRDHFRYPAFGVDIELLQGGRRVARLRVAGRCKGGGQSSRCRFKKISTKR